MMKKEDKVIDTIKLLTEEIRVKTENELRRNLNDAQKTGKHPWEGMWLTSQEIDKAQNILKKKDRIIFLELIVLFLVSIFFLLVLFVFFFEFLPGENAGGLTASTEHDSGNAAQSAIVQKVNIQIITTSKVDNESSQANNFEKEDTLLFGIPQEAKVNTDLLRLRKGPGIQYPIISLLNNGRTINVKEKSGEWLRVITDNSLDGWVFGAHIEIER